MFIATSAISAGLTYTHSSADTQPAPITMPLLCLSTAGLLRGRADVVHSGPQSVFDRPHHGECHPLSVPVRANITTIIYYIKTMGTICMWWGTTSRYIYGETVPNPGEAGT